MPDRVSELVADFQESLEEVLAEGRDAGVDEIAWDLAQSMLAGEPKHIRSAVLRELGF